MRPGDVVLVRFPFTEVATTKKRPALLLGLVSRGRRYQLATVAMITGQVEGIRLPGDVVLAGWQRADCSIRTSCAWRRSRRSTAP